MERTALKDIADWWRRAPKSRKPLIVRGARQVGKSFVVRDFCERHGLTLRELNFEKEPSLERLFVEGHNSKTISLLQVHFQAAFDERTVLFLDEIQSVPKVFSRLRYFFEDSPQVAVIAAGSLLEFALTEVEHAVPVGRVEYLFLGPLRFEEYLLARKESHLLDWISHYDPAGDRTDSGIDQILHDKLLSHVRDFSLIGGMPEVVRHFVSDQDFFRCQSIQRSILHTYRDDFGKFRKRIPLERLERVFSAIPAQVGKKWVHARVSPHEKAAVVEYALSALCMAKVAHRIFHSSGNGVPLAAERKDGLYKVLFLDVGLMSVSLGLRASDLDNAQSIERVNEGALAEQWVGQHLLDLRHSSAPPELHYWVREKTGAMAELDYLIEEGMRVVPVEVKAGASTRAKSLQVFLAEKTRSPMAVHVSTNFPRFDPKRRILELPFYLIDQLPRLLNTSNNLHKGTA